MNLKHVISDIVTNLARWKNRGLNEAQTSQVIVLRIFKALGYDIWDPFAVFAQNSLGKRVRYIPDFTMNFANKDRFIVEVKALGNKITNDDYNQPVNYVNTSGLRWAVLTNGNQWLFFDNNKQDVNATGKLVLTINLVSSSIMADVLEKLFSP